jgi:hypothetical protein
MAGFPQLAIKSANKRFSKTPAVFSAYKETLCGCIDKN